MDKEENTYSLEIAKKVFKKYFQDDLNLVSRIDVPSSPDLDVNPIKIKSSDITYNLGGEFKKYMRDEVIPRQIHKYFVEIMLQSIETPNSEPAQLVLKGPSGVGKTTSLLVIGHIAKEMNILVFPINARRFTNADLNTNAYLFLDNWRENNKELIDRLEIKDELNQIKMPTAINTMCNAIKYLKVQNEIPVLFIVDECNAFHHKHWIKVDGQLKEIEHPMHNPIGRCFNDISNWMSQKGGVLCAYSSIFEFASKFDSYNSKHKKMMYMIIENEIGPFTPDEFSKLINIDIDGRILSNQMYAGFDIKSELGPLLGFLPREFRMFQKIQLFVKDKNCLRNKYLDEATMRFESQLKKVFERSNDDKETKLNGMQMFFEFDAKELTAIWKSSGLCAIQDTPSGFRYRFSCPAIRIAYRKVIASQKKSGCDHFEIFANAIYVCNNCAVIKGFLLEMFFIFRCHMDLASVKNETPAALSFEGESFAKNEQDQWFNIKIRKIATDVDLQSPKDDEWQAGSVLIFKECTPVVDFAIIDAEPDENQNLRLYLFQVSCSSYAQNKSKADHLFEKKKDGLSIYDKICKNMKRQHQKSENFFHNYDFYIYIQASDTRKRKANSSFSSSQSNSKKSRLSTSSIDIVDEQPVDNSHQEIKQSPDDSAKQNSYNQTQCFLVHDENAKNFLGVYSSLIFNQLKKMK